MAAVHNFTAGQGGLWVQVNGPNTEPVYMGCHLVGDIDIPKGDTTPIYCKDPSGPNRYQIVGSLRGAAGAPSTTITASVTDVLDQLERANCPFTIYINMSKRGRSDVFANFDRMFMMTGVTVTNEGLSGLVAREPEDDTRSDQTFDVSGEEFLRLKEYSINRQSQSETSNFNDITFCNDQACRTTEDAAQESCELGFAVTDAATGSPSATANVMVTQNGGTWTASASDPFAAAEDISAVECFEFGRDTVRVIVARGTTDGSNPAEVAYSDDYGTTWVTADIGDPTPGDGYFIPTRHSLFALNRYNIWAGLDNGYIFESSDGGATWTAVESAVIHSGAWNAIRFTDDAVGWAGGAANVIAKTVDGGTSWSQVTGPSAEAANAVTVIEVLDRNRVWVGYDSGKLYYTIDGGTNWTERSFSGSGVGQIRDIKFFNENLGFLVSNNASPVGTVLWTVDGGFSWSALTTPTNAGINALYLCDKWNFFVAGEAQGGLGYIAKGSI